MKSQKSINKSQNKSAVSEKVKSKLVASYCQQIYESADYNMIKKDIIKNLPILCEFDKEEASSLFNPNNNYPKKLQVSLLSLVKANSNYKSGIPEANNLETALYNELKDIYKNYKAKYPERPIQLLESNVQLNFKDAIKANDIDFVEIYEESIDEQTGNKLTSYQLKDGSVIDQENLFKFQLKSKNYSSIMSYIESLFCKISELNLEENIIYKDPRILIALLRNSKLKLNALFTIRSYRFVERAQRAVAVKYTIEKETIANLLMQLSFKRPDLKITVTTDSDTSKNTRDNKSNNYIDYLITCQESNNLVELTLSQIALDDQVSQTLLIKYLQSSKCNAEVIDCSSATFDNLNILKALKKNNSIKRVLPFKIKLDKISSLFLNKEIEELQKLKPKLNITCQQNGKNIFTNEYTIEISSKNIELEK